MRSIIATFLITMGVLCRAPLSAQEGAPNNKISSVDKGKLMKIRNPKDWENPWLVVCPEGIRIRVSGVKSEKNPVDVQRLRSILMNLPRKAWPYGKVAAVSTISIMSRGEEGLREKNRQDVIKVLKEMEIEIWWWPSA